MSIAEDLINDAKSYAQSTLSSSISALGAAAASINAILTPPPPGAPSITIGPPTPTEVGDTPVYAGQRFIAPTDPASLEGLQNVGALVLPPSPGAAPELLEYVAPPTPAGEPSPEIIGAAPTTDRDLEVPEAADLLGAANLILKPTLVDIVVTAAPNFSAPEFLGQRPQDPTPPPTDLEGTMRNNYTSASAIMRAALSAELDAFLDREYPQHRAQLAVLEDRLTTYLAGGTALTPAIEAAILARTLERTNTEGRRTSKAAWERAGQMGHTVPGAVLLAQQVDLAQVARDANVRAAVEIAIEQAKLEQQNLQFAVTTSMSLRKIAMDSALAYYNGLVNVNGQAIEYARAIVDAIVKTYEIAAKYAEAQARIYEADTRVYEAKLRGALAVLEAYTAKVKGWEAQANVNTAKVNAYRAQIEALQAEATIYKAAIDGVMAQAQLEKNKVELYQARVSAYGAQVNAYSARWQGFEAAVRGQAAKLSASAETVKAYTAEVSAYEAIVRARAVEIDSISRSNEGKIRAYAAGIEAYSALIAGRSTAVKAELDAYGVELNAYVARSNAEAEHSKAEIEAYKTGRQALVEVGRLHLANLTENNKAVISQAEGLARVSVAAAEVFSAQSQAALSGMNTLAAHVTSATV